MEYDNTNTGAIFNSKSDQLILVGTGSLNDERMRNQTHSNGQGDKRIA